jgi:hypothetical protein
MRLSAEKNPTYLGSLREGTGAFRVFSWARMQVTYAKIFKEFIVE